MLLRMAVWNPNHPEAMVLSSGSAEATADLGCLLARLLIADDVIGLDGDLGAGKTVLVRGLAAGLKCEGLVTSPTFVLLNEHAAAPDGLPLFHFDAYRLSGSAEFCASGLDEFFYAGGISVVEWSSRIGDVLPERTLFISLAQADPDQPDLRRIELRWPGLPERLCALANLLLAGTGGDCSC